MLIFVQEIAYGTTDLNDLKILNDFKQGSSNPELLKWPETEEDDPCGTPPWPHLFCSGDRVAQIQVQNLGLKGPLPLNLNQLSKLFNLGLQKNHFNGKLQTFSGLSELKFAYLDNNEFDSIPDDFFDGLSSVRVLALDYNPFNKTTGWSIPNELANSAQLTNLSLVNYCPASFGESLMQILWLNYQDGEGMTGTIDVVANMVSLKQLWLHGNRFSGTIPENIGNLTSLKDLNLNRNQLVGLIPGSLASVKAGNFSYDSNLFCQSKPGIACAPEVDALLDFLGGMNYPMNLVFQWSGNEPCAGPWMGLSCNQNYRVLITNLPRRNLSGTLSPSLAKLESLMEIRLGGNYIHGTVPENFTDLGTLRTLDLSTTISSLRYRNFMKATISPAPAESPPSDQSGGKESPPSPNRDTRTKSSTATAKQPDSQSWFPRIQTVNCGSGSLFSKTATSSSCSHSGATQKSHITESGNLVISVQGVLEDGTQLAVKRMEAGIISNKALDEFQSEIAVLSKVQHQHLVSLLGYSIEGNERLLVYEFISQGDISKHLFHWKSLKLEPLSWRRRISIALDVARGMEYLHNLARQTFIHRDLKSSNILLDDDFRAKVRISVMGKISTKVDEETRYLMEWYGRIKSNKDKLLAAIDPALEVNEQIYESIATIAELACHCTAREPYHRPDMGHAVNEPAPLVEEWKPVDDESEGYSGIDYDQPLPQMLKVWQPAESRGVSYTNLDDSKGSRQDLRTPSHQSMADNGRQDHALQAKSYGFWSHGTCLSW
ncbi:histone deacetylase 8-like isoform X1 [Hibiscus syriacus]|uniref:Histone deacetylase 8-like isoform X1 n=1 Tax=Hibiscus syriacus TaxID=106335 RepID=A0A6A2X9B9_HIBSY|nr:histone deacetylase 8-like isoform X1 [Hibiscus syriacus]